MESCEKDHNEIQHSDFACPLCEARKKIGTLEGEIEELKTDNEGLQMQYDDLEADLC